MLEKNFRFWLKLQQSCTIQFYAFVTKSKSNNQIASIFSDKHVSHALNSDTISGPVWNIVVEKHHETR
jgi:hypothetical protein